MWWPAPSRRRSSTLRHRSTCAARPPTPRSTRGSTSRARSTCSTRPAGRACGACQHLHRRRDLRRGQDPPRARGPPGRARGAVRPVEVLRRGLLRACSRACTACRRSRCATATSTARARIRSARPASWPSSAESSSRVASPPSSGTAYRRATTSTSATWCRPISSLPSPRPSGAINIGTGIETTVLDLVEVLAKQAEGRFEAQHEPERPGEVRHIALDAARAQAELGWSAQVSMDEGLGRTLQALR